MFLILFPMQFQEPLYTDLPSPDQFRTSESHLLALLRTWLLDPLAGADDGRTLDREIRSALEWYTSECLSYGPPDMEGWWCDGVIHLEIRQTSADAVHLLGVAWLGRLGEGIAPFEIDLELDPKSDRHLARTLFRAGTRDESGRPIVSPYRRHTDHVLSLRPRRNRDWAMAVELTPPPPTEERDGSAQ